MIVGCDDCTIHTTYNPQSNDTDYAGTDDGGDDDDCTDECRVVGCEGIEDGERGGRCDEREGGSDCNGNDKIGKTGTPRSILCCGAVRISD